MKRPLLSVIVPAYNCEAYIGECLDSILDQLPGNCELVVVDDGSNDGTARILEEYRAAWPAVRIVPCEHRGASGARNAGLDAAAGEYVAFVDCDDCLREGFLAKGLALLRDDADLFIFGIERVPLVGNSEYWTVGDAFYASAAAFADAYIRVRQLMIYSNCNKFYRRDIIEVSGYGSTRASSSARTGFSTMPT